jgi:hypothetical protein
MSLLQNGIEMSFSWCITKSDEKAVAQHKKFTISPIHDFKCRGFKGGEIETEGIVGFYVVE